MNTTDLLARPFDQYQRYTIVAQVAELVRAHLGQPRLRALDVGGFFRSRWGIGILPLAHFLPQDDVFAVDLVAESLPNYALANGLSLPFHDQAFDLVISCDTLEHIPPPSRSAFVDELLRVARHCLVLTTPIASPLTDAAERILHEHITALGGHSRELQDHLDHPLPALNELLAQLAEQGLEAVDFADGYLPHWLMMMLIKHTPGQSLDFHLELDRFYNRHFSAGDRREPAYRHVLIIAQPGDEMLLPAIGEAFCPADAPFPSPNLDFASDLIRLLNLSQGAVWEETVQQINNQLIEAHARLAVLEAENARLQKLVAGYERGRFMRLMRWLHQLRSGFYGQGNTHG
jgi:SAM-dependent methyltransferase